MNYATYEILEEGSIWHDNVMYEIWWPLGYDNGLNQV